MSTHPVKSAGHDRDRWYRERWWRDDTLPTLLADAAATAPDRLGITDGDHRLTWSELRQAAAAYARWFAEAGVDRGDTAVIQIRDGAAFVAAMLGIQAVGGVAVPVLPSAGEVEVANIINRVSAAAYLGLRPPKGVQLGLVIEVDPAAGLPEGEVDEPFPPPGYDLDPDSVSDIMFTSGTTGRAKGVMNSHNTKLCGLRGLLSEIGAQPDDVWGVVAPMVHNAGWLYTFLPALASATTAAVIPGRGADAILDGLIVERVTKSFLVPTHAIDVLESFRRRGIDRSDLSLRVVLTGAAAAPPGLVRDLHKEMGVDVISLYGMTECQANLFTRPGDPIDIVEKSVGRPCPGAEVGLRGPDGSWIDVDDVPGEIVTRGPVVFLGYYDDQYATTSAFTKDGWLRSGDLAVRHRGNYEVVGRIKEVILRGGATITPQDVEKALSNHPAFRDVAVVGVPDDRLGERVCACVIGNAPSIEAVHNWLKQQGIGRSLWPDVIVGRNRFPTTALGKVQRARLRSELLEEQGSAC